MAKRKVKEVINEEGVVENKEVTVFADRQPAKNSEPISEIKEIKGSSVLEDFSKRFDGTLKNMKKNKQK
mgnify:CR=1 FL=1